jgi:hypothetical protein
MSGLLAMTLGLKKERVIVLGAARENGSLP